MDSKALLVAYEREGALLRGHFLLRSGMHSDRYLQSALFLARPHLATAAGEALADLLRHEEPEVVVSPAVGGVVIGHETARALGVRAFFAERLGDRFELRRGFRLARGERVVVVEDVVTTGGSVGMVLDRIEEAGAGVVAVGSLVDRSEGRARFPMPYHAVASLSLPVYSAERCPLCREGLPIQRPGSRGLTA